MILPDPYQNGKKWRKNRKSTTTVRLRRGIIERGTRLCARQWTIADSHGFHRHGVDEPGGGGADVVGGFCSAESAFHRGKPGWWRPASILRHRLTC